MRSGLAFLLLCLVSIPQAPALLANAPGAAQIYTDVPSSPDRAARYIFYLHGAIVERMGRQAVHPEYGAYEYDAIVKALAEAGFVVISEIRTGNPVRPADYAAKVAGQVTKLLAAGLPPEHVAVIGHSKGGVIALLAAAINNPRINYAVMAGCLRSGPQPGAELLSKVRGRILSIYDESDREAGSCKAIFTPAREVVLKVGLGHGVFFKPRKEWLDPVLDWARCIDCPK
ncbi:MAG: hypothetical protein HYX75_25425 [Acidobacteria bacterium]|nr:hypothetical protein [Acidobacteriota bacterium]